MTVKFFRHVGCLRGGARSGGLSGPSLPQTSSSAHLPRTAGIGPASGLAARVGGSWPPSSSIEVSLFRRAARDDLHGLSRALQRHCAELRLGSSIPGLLAAGDWRRHLDRFPARRVCSGRRRRPGARRLATMVDQAEALSGLNATDAWIIYCLVLMVVATMLLEFSFPLAAGESSRPGDRSAPR